MRDKSYSMEIPFLAENDMDAQGIMLILSHSIRKMCVPAADRFIVKDADGNIINPEFKEDD